MTETLDPAARHVAGAGSGLNGRELYWSALGGVPVVVKAGSGRHRSALRREAVVLRAVDGRGAVRLVDVDEDDTSTRLVLRDEGEATLAGRSSGNRCPLTTARIVAAAVADLHAAGWAHARLGADHVVLGTAGARLCSLADAVALDGSPSARAAMGDDVEALWSLLDGLTRRPAGDDSPGPRRQGLQRLRLRLRLHRARTAADHHPDVGAATLAAALDRGRGPAPGVDPRSDTTRRSQRRPVRRVAIGVTVVLTAALLVAAAVSHVEPARPAAHRRTAPPTPAAARVPAPQPGPCVGPACGGAVVGGRRVTTSDGRTFVVGLPGDRVAVGDWDCDGTPTVADLRPGTGELFEFRRWPMADDPAVDRRPVAAPGVRTLLRRGPDGCPQLWGRTEDGTTRRLLPVPSAGAGP